MPSCRNHRGATKKSSSYPSIIEGPTHTVIAGLTRNSPTRHCALDPQSAHASLRHCGRTHTVIAGLTRNPA